MKMSVSDREALLFRTILAMVLIILAAALRVAPHPWNLTPVGAIALFSGAIVKDRRLAFAFPLLSLLAGDLITGLPRLLSYIEVDLAVYASFVISVAIGLLLRKNRSVFPVAGATFLGALQFFLISNFAVWAFLNTYPKNASGLAACYITAIPLFWNTLAGDILYVALLFGGFALAERFFPVLRDTAPETVAKV
jgi:hypothetical protein